MPRISRFKWDALAEKALEAWERDKPEALACDTETTGYSYFDMPFGSTISWGDVPHYFELGERVPAAALRTILAGTRTLIFHNAKFDLHKLLAVEIIERRQVEDYNIEDTEALAHLIDEHQGKKLKELARKYLGEDTDEEARLKKVRQKLKLRKADGYDKLPREVILPYALKDADFTWNLWKLLRPQVEAHKDLLELYELEMQLTRVLLDIEQNGLGIAYNVLSDAIREYGDKTVALEATISSLVGKPVGKKVNDGEFNPNSPPQVLEAFNNRGQHLPGTSKHILSQVPDDLAKALLDYRAVQKVRGTYLIPMIEEQRDGVLHPNFRQHRTKTGRMASGASTE